MTGKEDYGKNGFDLLRYAAAFGVMMLHYTGYVMILSENLPDSATRIMGGIRHITLLFPGVVILFTISGFLVSASFEHTMTRKEFFLKRILRLYPELWICTIVNLMVISILVPELLDQSIILWLGTQIFGIANTPICLKSFATGSINGALWTIFTEIQLYLVLGLIYPFLQKIKIWQWSVLITALAVLNLVCDEISRNSGGITAKLIERTLVPYALWFFIGIFCFQKREKLLGGLKKAFGLMLVVYLAIELANIEIPGYYADIVTSILFPFIVIGCGYCLPKIRLRVDFSYGMFLYHWIILNIIVHYDLMNRWPWYMVLILFITGTIVAAVVSQKLTSTIVSVQKGRNSNRYSREDR